MINHLQDCGKDYRALNRVYLPQDMFSRYGDVLGCATRRRRRCCEVIAAWRTAAKVCSRRRKPFAGHIRDRRLALEVSVIQTFAEDLTTGFSIAIPCRSACIIAKCELDAARASRGVPDGLPGTPNPP